MIINYNNMKEDVLEHFKGGEKALNAKMFTDEKNKIFQGRLEPGATIGLHTHEIDSEIIYILKGTGKVLYDGEYEKVEAGVCHYCPKGHEHSLINDSSEDLIFFAVVPQQ
ncbi:Cupin domain-containing protein [Clostridium sp. DSM 8431]|uniref:cupin domain-containing protein n=1 Tax=Clostridium sp. DSM 8431 TaxID=1761781 RepID=UPI0008E10234|nr:cupin domain-containing protein [Clostridium sp. DSM 8431]SFU63212.1 Cupin domain-containing protein [Clostridium sp. DSM 8431]